MDKTVSIPTDGRRATSRLLESCCNGAAGPGKARPAEAEKAVPAKPAPAPTQGGCGCSHR